MHIEHCGGIAGARSARGVVVVIDVLRAFTVTAVALDRGASECRLVGTVAEALTLARRIPTAVISAEEEGAPVTGIPISNSPTQMSEVEIAGRTLIQRTTSGVQAVLAAREAERILVTGLVTAAATSRWLQRSSPALITLLASGEDLDHPEDRACALYLESLLLGRKPDLPLLLGPLRASQRFADLRAGRSAGFPPSDLEVALEADRYAFAMPVQRDALGLVVRADREGGSPPP
ncbi:MAG: 2-phosphosulfolactate phosphatase [Candidatus Dormibacter sp.]|uniref:2-phosphosulfolactate phosphatase n=1 Tax=Candidatus Dormibacter sp. TaxID=2973982 RepID=UPI000DB2977E|nr:MAG: 2-phosphosulfolactate phosphatase [Candidatus Dormibacteraeota bacterium]